MDDTRLIERWLPIAEIGIESLRCSTNRGRREHSI
jgi:hypothetical protein